MIRPPRMANRCAPLATPMIPGSAIGLRRAAWNKAPLTATVAPAKRAARIRGRRMLKMVFWAVGDRVSKLKWLAPLVKAIPLVTTKNPVRNR